MTDTPPAPKAPPAASGAPAPVKAGKTSAPAPATGTGAGTGGLSKKTVAMGAAVGIGSAAIVAALLYTRRR